MGDTMAQAGRRATTVLAALALTAGLAAPAPRADDDPAAPAAEPLGPAAAALRFRFGSKKVSGEDVADRLDPSVRAVLNAWADRFDALDLDLVVSDRFPIVVAGTPKEKHLRDVVEWMEQAWELVEPMVPVAPRHEPKALLALIFDPKGMHSDSWAGALEALGEDGLLVEQGVSDLKAHPGGLLMRFAPLFLQPTVDMAGNAAQGDDEFRLPNEVVNKTVQCLVTQRVGPVPPNVLWGLGYIAEQRLFKTSYMFDRVGFVAASDHFDWPGRAQRLIDVLGETTLADMVLDESAPGTAQPAQVLTWAVLDHLLATDPEAVAVMLDDFATLQRRGDSLGLASIYQGNRHATRKAVETALAGVDPSDLAKDLHKRW